MMPVDVKASVQRQFGSVAEEYAASVVHAQGADLGQMVTLAALTGSETVLDAGCGAGHTALAFAPRSARVIAYDLTETMLTQVERLANERGLTNLETRLGDVEALPFEDASFNLVVTRYSAHHWPNPEAALREFRRVVKPNGRVLMGDIVAPDAPATDTFLQTLELVRDISHVRDHSTKQWLEMFARTGFAAEVAFTWRLPLKFEAWVKRIGTPAPYVAILQQLMTDAPAEAHAYFEIQPDFTFTLDGALLMAAPV